jgi:hypothetical protein
VLLGQFVSKTHCRFDKWCLSIHATRSRLATPGKRGMMGPRGSTMHIRFIRTLLFAVVMVMLSMSATAFAQVAVGVVITIAPPPLPVYDQPLCPGENYIWTPGYWAYGDDLDDYYWVPGTWVLAPEVGFLWTPGYWAWGGNSFVFYDGYWGPRVGFYGGIVYGFGYFGEGYEGGRWDHDRFFYNTAVNNVNVTVIHNVYNTTVINNTTVTRVSYNGGNGGINRRPKPEEEAAARERHLPPVPVQREHAQAARTDPELRASVNRGKPPVAATPKPGAIKEPGVVPAKAPGGPYTPPANRGKNQARDNAPASGPENRPDNNASRPNPPVHPRDLPPAERPGPPNTGNPKQDQKYQQQQEKQFARQEQDRQKLQQKQDREDQRVVQQKDEARKQQVEQRHQQQTQQLQQKQEQQQRQTQEKQQPRQKPDKQQPPDRNKPPN